MAKHGPGNEGRSGSSAPERSAGQIGRSDSYHVPVLLHETLDGLDVKPGSVTIDGTVGGGGHSAAILARSAPDGRVLGLDADPAAIERVAERFPEVIRNHRLVLVHANFARMESVARVHGFTSVDAILLDLGASSFQFDQPERGFSFQEDGPLDMRMNPHQNLTAAVIVNEWSETEIADTLYELGDERKSRRIARRIVAQRPIRSTRELAQIVEAAVGGRRGMRIHPATRTFQALRIAVNEELESLEATLPQCLDLLRPGGRLAVIAFHSLEDRIVKRWLQFEAADFVSDPAHPMGGVAKQPRLRPLVRKPIVPTDAEVARNPRSRSAKLRLAEKIAM